MNSVSEIEKSRQEAALAYYYYYYTTFVWSVCGKNREDKLQCGSQSWTRKILDANYLTAWFFVQVKLYLALLTFLWM
jgi:hypothetical protein